MPSYSIPVFLTHSLLLADNTQWQIKFLEALRRILIFFKWPEKLILSFDAIPTLF